jgi:hypothetical protein
MAIFWKASGWHTLRPQIEASGCWKSMPNGKFQRVLMLYTIRHLSMTRKPPQNKALGCSGQVISDSPIDFFDVDSRSKALGDMLPSFECSLALL